jgi:hypothetical protein
MFSPLASRPARFAAAALVAGGLVLGTAACTPNTTDLYYGASDGTRVALEANTLEVINLMILTSGEGGVAEVHGAVHNKTTNDEVARIVGADGELDLSIPLSSRETVNFSTDEVDATTIGRFSAKPGSSYSATLTDQAGNSIELHIPVLDGTLPEYQDSAPQG